MTRQPRTCAAQYRHYVQGSSSTVSWNPKAKNTRRKAQQKGSMVTSVEAISEDGGE
ncbi:MAG: hypothetical protein J6A47_04990 [Bacilli bacterium]|nr:hypothetical protein [Bacilli bacterium]MBO6285132.1 hypothetical protein [Bacilli bacterium]